MKAILNDEILKREKVLLNPENRGFSYGDGLFETIAIIGGKPRFLGEHLARLQNGSKVLKLKIRDILNPGRIQAGIEALQKENNIPGDAKLKLMVWRNAEGLYAPSDGHAHYLMTLEQFEFHSHKKGESAGISRNTVNYPNILSRFKTMSALKYVIAGMEKEEKGLDEIIILDHMGYVSEALSSNLFWKRDNIYFTPPLSTGCIEGVMRHWLMNELGKNGFAIKEKKVKKSELLKSHALFTVNALGISHIGTVEKHHFNWDKVAQKMIESIGRP